MDLLRIVSSGTLALANAANQDAMVLEIILDVWLNLGGSSLTTPLGYRLDLPSFSSQ